MAIVTTRDVAETEVDARRGIAARDRRSVRTVREQLAPLAPLGIVWLTGLLVMSIVFVQDLVPAEQLLLDPSHLGQLPWYTGLVSGIGILIWTVAACAATFGSFAAMLGNRRGATRFLAQGAVLALLLTLDDLFLLHGVIQAALGVPKLVALCLIPMGVLVWAVLNRTELVRTRFQLLLAAGFALLCSAAMEPLPGGNQGIRLLLEDGAKLLGILAWATYFVTTAADITRSVVVQARESQPTGFQPSDGGALLSPDDRSLAHDS